MIIRRLSNSLRKQDWFTVLIEILIVVVGVFLGIQVSNWNDARSYQVKEAAYVQRLDKDFDIIRQRLIEGESSFRQSVESANLLLKARRVYLGQDLGELPDDQSILAALDDLGSGMVPAGVSAAFLEMVSSGELKILNDEKLRNALFEYDQFAGVARDAWKTLRDTYIHAVILVLEVVELEAVYDQEGRNVIRPIGFDRDRFFSQDLISDRIGIVMNVQENQRGMVARQLKLAELVESLIAAERLDIAGSRARDPE